MDIPQIGTPLGSMLVTCCLWFWTIRKGKSHLFQHEVVLRIQNKYATWAFVTCLGAQIGFASYAVNPWLASITCYGVFMVFVTACHPSDEGFWRKKRNILVGGLLMGLLFVALGQLFRELYFVPLCTAILIAHICHSRFLTIFNSNLKDLEALQAKLLRHDAERRNQILDPALDSYSQPIETIA